MAEEQTQEQTGQEQAQAQPAEPEKIDYDAEVMSVLADGEPKRCTMTTTDFTKGNTAEILLALGKLQTEGKVEQVRNPRMAQDGVEFVWQLVKKEEEPKQEAPKEEKPSGEQQEAAAQPEGERQGGSPHS